MNEDVLFSRHDFMTEIIFRPPSAREMAVFYKSQFTSRSFFGKQDWRRLDPNSSVSKAGASG
jgi:hypothetical protein